MQAVRIKNTRLKNPGYREDYHNSFLQALKGKNKQGRQLLNKFNRRIKKNKISIETLKTRTLQNDILPNNHKAKKKLASTWTKERFERAKNEKSATTLHQAIQRLKKQKIQKQN